MYRDNALSRMQVNICRALLLGIAEIANVVRLHFWRVFENGCFLGKF